MVNLFILGGSTSGGKLCVRQKCILGDFGFRFIVEQFISKNVTLLLPKLWSSLIQSLGYYLVPRILNHCEPDHDKCEDE